jgi:hypothetical protein
MQVQCQGRRGKTDCAQDQQKLWFEQDRGGRGNAEFAGDVGASHRGRSSRAGSHAETRREEEGKSLPNQVVLAVGKVPGLINLLAVPPPCIASAGCRADLSILVRGFLETEFQPELHLAVGVGVGDDAKRGTAVKVPPRQPDVGMIEQVGDSNLELRSASVTEKMQREILYHGDIHRPPIRARKSVAARVTERVRLRLNKGTRIKPGLQGVNFGWPGTTGVSCNIARLVGIADNVWPPSMISRGCSCPRQIVGDKGSKG